MVIMENVKFRITKNVIEVDLKSNNALNLKISANTHINRPKSDEEQSILFIFELNVNSQDENKQNENRINIYSNSEWIFRLDKPYKDEDEESLNTQCARIALKKISELIDLNLVFMGYPKLELYEKSDNIIK